MASCNHVTKSLTPIQRSEHREKVELQEVFAHRLNRFFGVISREAGDLYSAVGQVLDVEQFRPELINIFKQHYLLVSSRFLNSDAIVKKSIVKQSQEIITQQVIDQIAAQIGIRASTQTDLILNTTQKNLNKSLEQTAVEFDDMSNSEISAIAITQFDLDTDTQVDRTAVTETQNAAESTKFIEASIAAGLLLYNPETGAAETSDDSFKSWSSILIETTRDIHREADGQVVPIKEPFVVGGEQLRFPGDDSLGAGPHNLIECLCSVEYIVG